VSPPSVIVDVTGWFREVSRMAGAERPKRVVVVDADNPLAEINGELFWREDHEEILARERDSAFQRGYPDGVRDTRTSAPKPFW
jgi:hypothetical protein